MSQPLPVSRQRFLKRLRRSGLLTAEELVRAEMLEPESSRGRILARTLVKEGTLTRFQAERLLFGQTAGFHIDQYVILDQLGQGGMGRVYKARHRAMNRVVALKVLLPELTRSERCEALFLREVMAVARLVHPHIVTAFDADRSGNRHYLVLEYVEGPNHEQLVSRNGPLEVGLACDYIRQAANGLQAAYMARMVHRDIKPANLLVQLHDPAGGPGLLKISDFGLARLHVGEGEPTKAGTIITKPNTVMGTPDFLSPEQARSVHKTDIRSDLYSLGCTFYYLLTGMVPFPGGTALEKLIRHCTEEPVPIEQARPGIPAEVAAILRKMMAKRPEDRHQTPLELAQAMQPFAISGPTPWEPSRSPEESWLGAAPSDGLCGQALVRTSPQSESLTPTPEESFPSRPAYTPRAPARQLWKWLLVGAAGVALASAAIISFATRG